MQEHGQSRQLCAKSKILCHLLLFLIRSYISETSIQYLSLNDHETHRKISLIPKVYIFHNHFKNFKYEPYLKNCAIIEN